MDVDLRPLLAADPDGDLGAGAHRAASDQLQIDQQGAGGSQLRGRQLDLEMREQVRAVGLDPARAQCGLSDFSHHAGARAVEMGRQCGNVDADGGDGHGHDLVSDPGMIFCSQNRSVRECNQLD